ncbi:MAG: hypothetical protein KJZ77_13700 [Anaerolineales bacterium]|nr:hypothetical protein [Anaerolineales bacterium]
MMHKLAVFRSPIFTSFLTLGWLVVFFSVMSAPSDPKNAVFLGYSLERIVLGAGFLLLFLSLLVLTLHLLRRPEHSQRFWLVLFHEHKTSRITFWVVFFVFVACWILLFIPSYRLTGVVAGYISRVYPALIWLAVVGAVMMLILILERKRESLQSILLKDRTALWSALVVLAIFSAIGILMTVTGLGIRHWEDYWYGAGVPVLVSQVLFAASLGALALWIENTRKIKNERRLDVFICLAVWLVTAWLWAREPLASNYFFPSAGNNAIYPYSDSATFDIGSQFALIGQGLFNGQYFDRVLYSAFLTYLHVFIGQDTEGVMAAQAVVFAVFPVITYLLGRELHSRAFGLSVAGLLSLRGLNAIVAARWIDTASPKMMLTDFPAAIGVSLLVLFFVKWLKDPSRLSLAMWAGGMLGLTLMLRTHVFLLAPLLILFIVVPVIRMNWDHRIAGSLVLVAGMLAATTPWDIRNQKNGVPMFYIYYSRIQLILQERYGIQDDAHVPSSITADAVQKIRASLVPQDVKEYASPIPLQIDNCDSRICSLFNHFVHNLYTSVLFFPSSFTFDGVWNTVKEGEPFWQQNWLGEGASTNGKVFLGFSLVLVSLGIGAAWRRNKLIGILPVGIFLAYGASNALAFTSGGRYIVPVDWIVAFYFMLGIFQLGYWLLRWGNVVPAVDLPGDDATALPPRPFQYSKVFASFLLILFIGSLVPLAEMPFEMRYQTTSQNDIVAMLEEHGWLEQAQIAPAELTEFLSDPQSRILMGRVLYPRYFIAGVGESKRIYPYQPLDYARLAFILIGPFGSGTENVVIAGLNPNFSLHANDVVVIGCREDQFLDALVVISLEPAYVYHRFPPSELACPPPAP